MKQVKRMFWLVALFLFVSIGMKAVVNPKPFVIPELKEWKGNEGTFVPNEKAKVVYTSDNAELQRVANLFAEDYKIMFGRSLEVLKGKGEAGDFIFSQRADKKLGKEGY